jgi:hypothetical protein
VCSRLRPNYERQFTVPLAGFRPIARIAPRLGYGAFHGVYVRSGLDRRRQRSSHSTGESGAQDDYFESPPGHLGRGRVIGGEG